ncbi:MAG TPA: hypothetical protein VHE30_08755 [Polyangiaceae bacterium]|nr:hypothetical protein [Polyangiaceae bacterium]
MSTNSGLAARVAAVLRRLERPSAAWVVLGLATLLAATSVGTHRVLDDFVLSLIARGEGGPLGLHRGQFDLFTFTTGDPANNRELMETGLMLPWWTDPALRISFFRPLSSLSHRVDEWLWPSSAVLMHLHSLAWFSGMLGAALLVYRRLEPRALLVGIAFALYALDDAHGPMLAWIANRNALIATLLGCLSLASHDASRRAGRPVPVLGPSLFLAGLLAGEAAIGTLAYVAAYGLFRDEKPAGARALSLAPYGAVLVLWRVAWSAAGFGAKGSGAYVDPLGSPGHFLSVLPGRLAVMVQGQFSVIQSDQAFLGPPPQAPIVVALGFVAVGLVVWVLRPILREDGSSRFWATGMLLAALPLAATFPSDRLLSFVGLGAMPLVARVLERAFLASEAVSPARALAAWALFGIHGVVAPLALPVRAAQMEIFGAAHDRAAAGIPSTADVRDETVVLVSAPTVIFANYVQAERALEGIPRPKHLYLLASASSALDVARVSPDALTVRPAAGFLYSPLERHYRGTAPLRVGDRVELAGLEAEVTAETPDGRPASVRFTFPDAPGSYRFMTYQDGRFVPFALPEPGRHVSLPEEDFTRVLVKSALSGFGAR